MKTTLFLAITGMVAMLWLSACGGGATVTPTAQPAATATGSSRMLTAVQLRDALQRKDFLFVNVHIPPGPQIPGTDKYVPYDKIEQNLSSFPSDKAAKIVVYCRSGSMSAVAVRDLARFGFSNVWDVEGGTVAWEAQGFELRPRPE